MSAYKRNPARRNKRRMARKSLFLAAFIFSVVIFVVAVNAIAIQPLVAMASGSDDALIEARRRRQENTNPSIRQSESVDSSDQQAERTHPSAQNEDEGWMLTLINAENPLPDNHSPELKSLENGLKFEERAIAQLNTMLSVMRKQGLSPVVCSAYRSIEYQKTLFNDQVNKHILKGLSREQAESEARKSVAYPGTSEHNLGLAADIVSIDYQLLDEKQADTPEAKWLIEHCTEYGFILRYPKDKTDITGVIYEPWHFRYVGVEAATEIMESGLCLEEYLIR